MKTIRAVFFSGPLHGKYWDVPITQYEIDYRCIDAHPDASPCLLPPPGRPQCLEQKEIEALTGKSYSRLDHALLESMKRERHLWKKYVGKRYQWLDEESREYRSVRVFFWEDVPEDPVQQDRLHELVLRCYDA